MANFHTLSNQKKVLLEVTGTGPPEIQVTTFSLFAQLRIPFLQPASGILHQGPSGIQEFHRPANIIGYYISIQYYTIINHSWISPFLMTFNMIESFEPPKVEQNYTFRYRTVTHPLKFPTSFGYPSFGHVPFMGYPSFGPTLNAF